MRIIANQGSAGRVGKALDAHELVQVDAQGKCTLGGKPIAAKDAKPDIVWLTFDALMGGQLDLFFDVAIESGTVKWFHTQQTGLDSPRYQDVVAKGIKLTNSHAQAPAIAEYVLANVLAETWPIAASRAAQQAKEWKRLLFRELGQSHWLIVGFGAIGQEIAKRAKGFGARVTGINRSGNSGGIADAMGTLADLPRLLPTADIVVLAAAHNDATNDLVNRDFVTAMKPGSMLVNIGRGQLVVDEALLAGLDQNAPALAILDVFRTEPLPKDHPFWTHPKVRVTGHTSSSGNGTLGRADGFFLENLKRFESGRPLLSPVSINQF